MTSPSLQTAESLNDYVERLCKQGMSVWSERGKFSRVFSHPTRPDIVVKVFSTQDTGYMTWLEICQQMPFNPWVPTVQEVHYPENSPEVGIAFLPKLRPATARDCDRFFGEAHDVIFALGEHATLFEEIWEVLFRRAPASALAEIDPALVPLISKVRPLLSSFKVDVHIDNVMLDARNRLVIIDPLAPKNFRRIKVF